MILSVGRRKAGRWRWNIATASLHRWSVPERRLLQTGDVFVLVPSTLADLPEEAKPSRYRKADARRTLGEQNPDGESLAMAIRFFPSQVLAHPAFGLLSLVDPETSVRLRRKAELKIARRLWRSTSLRLSLDQARRLAVAALFAAEKGLDEQICGDAPGEQVTRRVACWLAAVMDKQVSRALARRLLKLGIAGGPPPTIRETASEIDLRNNREALRVLTATVILVIGPPRSLDRTTDNDGRSATRHRTLRNGFSARSYWPLEVLDQISDAILATDGSDRRLHWRWMVAAARAILRGKAPPAAP